jgi:hypothetical protein
LGGLRKLRIHQLFPDPSDFARVVVDVHRVAKPTVSFLDLTSVIEGQYVADEREGSILAFLNGHHEVPDLTIGRRLRALDLRQVDPAGHTDRSQ